MESVTLSDPAEDALGFQRWLRPQRSAPRALDLYTPRGCGQAAGGPQGATAARIPPTPAPLTVWYYIHYLYTHTHINQCE